MKEWIKQALEDSQNEEVGIHLIKLNETIDLEAEEWVEGWVKQWN
jgi:hypothetical protein